MKSHTQPDREIFGHIWEVKYRYRQIGEIINKTIKDTWKRIVRVPASAEPKVQEKWGNIFYEQLGDFGFLSDGRILTGARTDRKITQRIN